MRKRRSLLLTALTAIIALAFIGTMGTVSADETAYVYIYPDTWAGPITEGTIKTFQVRLSSSSGSGAPHITTEPAVNSDKTWSWEVVIDYDPTWVNVSAGYPIRHTTRDWFNCFHKWDWDADFEEWIDLGSYSNAFVGAANNIKGEVAGACSLLEDVTTIALPSGTFPFPNQGLHAGSYYDLPYTDGISTSTLATPPGSWTGDYFILYYFRMVANQDMDEGGKGTYLNITEASFLDYGLTKYTVDTCDPVPVGYPAVPEFPIGFELALGTGVIAAVVYVWLRKRKTKPTVAKRFTTPSQ